MELNDWTWAGLLVAGTALCACGSAQTDGETAAAAPVTPVAGNADPASSSRGMAQYPGMQTLVEAHRTPVAKRGDLIESDFKSADPPEKTAAFYREQLSKRYGEDTQYLETPLDEGMVRLQATDGERRNVEVLIRPDGAGSIVGVRTLGTSN